MQNIGTLGKCPDTVLIQAQGATGDQVDRDVAMAKSLNEYNKATGQVPERDQAQVYGQAGWKPVSQKVSEAAGVASVPDSATE
jgi:hypothetical protein